MTNEALELSINLVWVMLGAFFVFFMHAGFAMVEAGFTRSKNAVNILMKNVLTISIGGIVYFVAGYAIMFGDSAGGFIGTSGFAMALTISHSSFSKLCSLQHVQQSSLAQ